MFVIFYTWDRCFWFWSPQDNISNNNNNSLRDLYVIESIAGTTGRCPLITGYCNKVGGATYTFFNLYLQRFEVDSSLARLPGYSLTKEPQCHGTPLVPRPSKVCTFHPQSAWNPLQSGRLVTSPSSHNSRWFAASCHTSHNRIRKETLYWNFF